MPRDPDVDYAVTAIMRARKYGDAAAKRAAYESWRDAKIAATWSRAAERVVEIRREADEKLADALALGKEAG